MKQKPETAGTIHFYGTTEQPATEVLRLSRDGIWANPDVPADDAAKAVLSALDFNIKLLVERVVQDEREACARLAQATWQTFYDTKRAHERNAMEPFSMERFGFKEELIQQSLRIADAIRARGKA